MSSLLQISEGNRKLALPVKISKGNTKMGRVPSVSFPPCGTCEDNAPCKDDCYSLKAWRMYEATRNALRQNIQIYRENPRGFFEQINAFIAKRKPPLFRFEVSGDMPDRPYLGWLYTIAKANPGTRFLVFTKRYSWVADYVGTYGVPANLSIVLSAWPGYQLENPHGLPVAWMQDGTEDRVPSDAIHCPGNCETCGLCYGLPSIGRDVVFNKH